MNANLTPKNKEILIIGTLLVLGLFTRFFGISYQSIWIDEGSTFYFTHYSFSELMKLSEPNSPIYHVMEGMFLRIFGQNEFALRFISAVAGALTVPLAYMLSMRLFRNRPAAIVTAALFLLSPICLYYGQEGRGYMLVAFIFMLQILVMVEALETKRNLYWVIFAVLSAVQFIMHYSGIIGTFTLYLYILYHCCRNGLSKDRYRSLIQMLWSGLLFVILVSPLLYGYLNGEVADSGNKTRWSWCFVGLEYAINHLNDLLFGFPLSILLILVVAVSLYLCYRRYRDTAVMLAIIGFFPVLFLTLWSLYSNVSPRYALWSVSGLYLAIPFFMCVLDPKVFTMKKGIAAVSAVLILLAVFTLPTYYTEITKEDFRTGAHVLEENVRPGDLVLYALDSENPVYASISFYYDPIKDGIETKGVDNKEELWTYTDSGTYANIYILILAEYDPLDYLLHLDSANCEHICEAYRINVFKITGPLPH